MSYALAALGLDQTVIARLKAIGPKCFSADLDDCTYGHNPSYPNCAEISKIKDEHNDEYIEWEDSLGWCPQAYEKNYTVFSPGYVGIAEAAVIGAVVGVALFHLLT